MESRLLLLPILTALLLMGTAGCGDETGCGPAPEKKEAPSGGGPGPGPSGSSQRAAELNTADKRGRVPKQYRLKPIIDDETAKSTATISKPVIAAPPPAPAKQLPVGRITKTKLDGVADRVEVTCRIIAVSPDGQCSNATNYEEIKTRCCPDGLVERCKTSTSGVILVGRGCNPAR